MGLHISEFTNSISSPARTYIWSVTIQGFPQLGNLRAQTSQFPMVGSQDIELYYQGQKVLFAGAVEYEHTWKCTFAEDENGQIASALYAWRNDIWQEGAALQQIPTQYKRTVVIKALRSLDGSAWLTGELKGAYLKTIDAVDVDRSAATNAWKWDCTFNYDFWLKS